VGIEAVEGAAAADGEGPPLSSGWDHREDVLDSLSWRI